MYRSVHDLQQSGKTHKTPPNFRWTTKITKKHLRNARNVSFKLKSMDVLWGSSHFKVVFRLVLVSVSCEEKPFIGFKPILDRINSHETETETREDEGCEESMDIL